MIDNSELNYKIILRNKVFKFYDSIDKVIDYYSGQCVISNLFWSKIANEVISIDKKNQNEIISNKIKRIVGDNNMYLNISRNVSVIDCDAYGLVMPFVSKIIDELNVDKLIFFTDGTPTKQKKIKQSEYDFKKAVEKINPDFFEYSENMKKTAYYGVIFKKINKL